MDSTFRYAQVKIRCTRLPGVFRIDPLAVIYTGSAGSWTEAGVTETRANEWNPAFATGVTLPADNSSQKNVELRVDIYNKERADSRFIGTASVNLGGLIEHNEKTNEEAELALELPSGKKCKSRVFLRVLKGYNPLTSDNAGGTFSLAMQLGQTQYWGVSMKVFYEISSGENGVWTPVYKSDVAKLDRQGWGQFDSMTISLRDLCRDDVGTHLLFTLYRQRMLGHKRVLGTWQSSVQKLSRSSDGELMHFSPNTAEDILAADVLVAHTRKTGNEYSVGFKLVNVRWNAPEVEEHAV